MKQNELGYEGGKQMSTHLYAYRSY